MNHPHVALGTMGSISAEVQGSRVSDEVRQSLRQKLNRREEMESQAGSYKQAIEATTVMPIAETTN